MIARGLTAVIAFLFYYCDTSVITPVLGHKSDLLKDLGICSFCIRIQ